VAEAGGADRKIEKISAEYTILPSDPQISIIIVNHLTDHLLTDCIESINKLQFDGGIEIIIIDNPNAQSGELSLNLHRIKRFETGKRLGYGTACNIGAGQAHGKYLLFLNPDVTLKPDSVAELLRVLVENKDAGLSTARLLDIQGKFQPSCRRFPTIGKLLFSRGSALNRAVSRRDTVYAYPEFSETTAIETCAAAVILIERELFLSLGGFDEKFYMYVEDTDLCRRLYHAGYKVYFVPQAEGVHIHGASTCNYRFRRIIWHHVSVFRYFRKHRAGLLTFLILPLLLTANCCLSLLMELFRLRS